MTRPFLTAQWVNLFLATYEVPTAILEKRLPAGLELDTRGSQAFASLVGFQFRDTRVWGIAWPGYRAFPEWNLRFYVRAGQERGVMFVREFVRERLIADLARWIYNEPYAVAPLVAAILESDDRLGVEYRLHHGGRWHTLQTTGRKPARPTAPDSFEDFLKEQRWGFGTSRDGQLLRYEVRHPHWDIYPIESYSIDIDWERAYGPEWRFLQGTPPVSTILAAGSAVSVFPHGRLRDTGSALCPRGHLGSGTPTSRQR